MLDLTYKDCFGLPQVEVGIGHAGDATNALASPPLVAVITPVALDHSAVQGDSISSVATHECSVIKAGTAAVVWSTAMDSDALRVIRTSVARCGISVAKEAQPLQWAPECQGRTFSLPAMPRLAYEAPPPGSSPALTLPIPLLGDFQLQNAGVALAVLRVLQSDAVVSAAPRVFGRGRHARITDEGICRGFAATKWPGRLELCHVGPEAAPGGFSFLLDGGHNEHALSALRHALAGLRGGNGSDTSTQQRRLILVYGGTSSRDLPTNLSALLSGDEFLFAVPFPTPEGMPWIQCYRPEDVVAAVAAGPFPGVTAAACGSLREGVEAALELSRCGGAAADALPPLLVVCGSLYLVSEAYRCFRL
jgi:dihydrofolate synthase/folylpolyglutamate synthase